MVHYYLSASLDTLLAIYNTAALYIIFPISYDLLLVPCFDFVIFGIICRNSAVHIKQKDGTRWFEYLISIWYSYLYLIYSSTIYVSKGPKSGSGLS